MPRASPNAEAIRKTPRMPAARVRNLLRDEDLAEAQAGDLAHPDRHFVQDGEGDVRLGGHQVFGEQGRVVEPFENRDVDLGVRLQNTSSRGRPGSSGR